MESEEKTNIEVVEVKAEEPQAEPEMTATPITDASKEEVETQEVIDVEPVEVVEEKPKVAELDIHLNIGKPPSYLKDCLELLDRLKYDEVTFRFMGGNLRIFEMDSARVCLVSANFTVGLEASQDVAFKVKVKPILRVLKIFDNPHMRVEGNKLIIEDKDIVYPDGKTVTVTPKRYETSVLEPDEDIDIEQMEKNLENLNLQASGRVDFSKLWKLTKIFSKDSEVDHVRFECNNLELVASFRGEFEFLRVRLGQGEGEAKASYSIHYLKAFRDEWNIKFGTDQPMRLHDHFSGITVYLAPRIEVD